jgi:hypothetical protein
VLGNHDGGQIGDRRRYSGDIYNVKVLQPAYSANRVDYFLSLACRWLLWLCARRNGGFHDLAGAQRVEGGQRIRQWADYRGEIRDRYLLGGQQVDRAVELVGIDVRPPHGDLFEQDRRRIKAGVGLSPDHHQNAAGGKQFQCGRGGGGAA